MFVLILALPHRQVLLALVGEWVLAGMALWSDPEQVLLHSCASNHLNQDGRAKCLFLAWVLFWNGRSEAQMDHEE